LWSRWPDFPACATAASGLAAAGLTRCEDTPAILRFLQAHAPNAPDTPRAAYALARFAAPVEALHQLRADLPRCLAIRDQHAHLLLRVEAEDLPSLAAALASLGALSYERLDVAPTPRCVELGAWLDVLRKPPIEAREGDAHVAWLLDCDPMQQGPIFAHLTLLNEVEWVDALVGGGLLAALRGPQARLAARLASLTRRPGVGRVRALKVIGDL
ncbi:hypothetical protein KKB55_20365, partial [Myxococcota bacterium]|nr:hypothetical protein [Myxococcota bacterium]